MANLIKRKEKWISKEETERQIEITIEKRKERRERDEKDAQEELGDRKKGIKGKADKILKSKYAGAGRGPPIEESEGFCYGESKDISIIPTDDLSDKIEIYANGRKLKTLL